MKNMIKVTKLVSYWDGNQYHARTYAEAPVYLNKSLIGIVSESNVGGAHIVMSMTYAQGCTNKPYEYDVKETVEEIIEMIDDGDTDGDKIPTN